MLHNVSLNIRAGERLALVGASGGGKTTLCNLIPRFYEVTSGRILIDGQDIRHVTLKSLRDDIGIVQQDVYLFSGTVAQNIAYGKPGATREEIMEAARLAGAEKFILALKDGFDTYVGERGVKLSGGQKQRAAVARALITNPELVLADEPSGALDSHAADGLMKLFGEINEEGQTIVMVTHSVKAACSAKRVLFIKDGEVFHQLYRGSLGRDEMYQKIVENRSVKDTDARGTAQIVGLSAIKYGDLSNQASKDYVFDVERFTSFEGNTGPYILYTIVRTKSILGKYKEEGNELKKGALLAPKSDSEKALMLSVSRFNGVVENAFEEKAPHKICAYIYEVSNAFNSFYHETKILSEENQAQKESFLKLLGLTKDILETSIDLLGFSAPDRM